MNEPRYFVTELCGWSMRGGRFIKSASVYDRAYCHEEVARYFGRKRLENAEIVARVLNERNDLALAGVELQPMAASFWDWPLARRWKVEGKTMLCAGCGVSFNERTRGCASCQKRHSGRRMRAAAA